MSFVRSLIPLASLLVALGLAPAVHAQQAPATETTTPPAAAAPPVDEAAMTAELKRLYTYPVLANECGYELSDAEFVRLDSAIGIAEERSAFAEEKLDELFNGVENDLKESLFKAGQDAACKEREAGFKAFVTGLPD